MNLDNIQTFLDVVEAGSISNASKRLFLSQSSVSTRLKNLEESIGFKLIERDKGFKTIELTPQGEEFIRIAKQFNILKDEIKTLKNESPFRDLKIASVDAVNNFTFVPLYKKFMKENPDIKLHIKTHHSDEIHNLVATGEADIGLVYSEIKYPDVISSPIFRELNYLICNKESPYYDGISPSELNLSSEVYLNWSQDFYHWHYHFFGENSNKLLTVNTGSLLSHYMDTPGNWAIAPMSVIKSFKENLDIVHYNLNPSPPPRFCYLLVNSKISNNKKNLIERFKTEMFRFIESDSSICTFHTWMFDELI